MPYFSVRELGNLCVAAAGVLQTSRMAAELAAEERALQRLAICVGRILARMFEIQAIGVQDGVTVPPCPADAIMAAIPAEPDMSAARATIVALIEAAAASSEVMGIFDRRLFALAVLRGALGAAPPGAVTRQWRIDAGGPATIVLEGHLQGVLRPVALFPIKAI
jgi:hypothetical protein